MIYFFDIETRARVSVTDAGLRRHAHDPETDLLVVCARAPGGEMMTWRSTDEWDAVEPFLEHIEAGGLVAAHNSEYDRTVWNAQRHKYDLPEIKLEQTVDTAAWLRQFNLPSALGDVSRMLLPPEQAKLVDTAKDVKFMWSKANDIGTPEDMDKQVLYCARDVDALIDVMALVPAPTQSFLEQFWACARMNARGVEVDLDMAEAARTLKPRVERQLLQEIHRICGDEVKLRGPSFLCWLEDNLPDDLQDLLTVNRKKRVGYEFRTEQKRSADKGVRAKLAEAIEDRTDVGRLRQALFAFEEANRAAVTKYAAMEKVAHEGRVHDQFVFAGAAQTGRASAKGIQLQNTVRDVPKDADDLIEVVKYLCQHPKVLEEKLEMTANTALSRLVRPTLRARDGHVLAWSDWSAIEARMLPWLTADKRAEPVLQTFREGGDIYVQQAEAIYGRPIDEAAFTEERQVGKVAVLSLGYQGGVGAFQSMARNYGYKATDAFANDIKIKWRDANPWAPRFWADLEWAAMAAVREPGTIKEAGRVRYLFAPDLLRGTLLAFLPSGRFLAYPEADIVPVTKFDEPQPSLVFVHPQYGPSATYGGALCENATQGECATLLREALVACDAAGLSSVLQVHDEIVIEAPESDIEADAARLVEIMQTVPAWAEGLPLKADAGLGRRYKGAPYVGQAQCSLEPAG